MRSEKTVGVVLSLLGLMGAVMTLLGQITQTNLFSGVNLRIPDGDSAGVEDVRSVVSDIHQITSVRVRLNISGEFNGDLYGYLRHDDGLVTHLCVLINRVGRSATNNYGYADSGFDVTIDDLAAKDIHIYRDVTGPLGTNFLSGTWQPDARFVDPSIATATSPRTVFLNEFEGLSASGEWTLFLADMYPGGTNFLNSWGLELTGKAMPVITWTNPAPILYGTALSPDQLNATADVPGTFTYNPPAGTVLAAGSNQTLSVTFVPDDTNAYLTASANAALDVLPQTLTVTANNTSKTYGNMLIFAGTEFTAIGLVNGDSVSYVSLSSAGAAATAPVGSYDIAPTASSGTGLANYTIQYVPGTLSVAPAALVVQADDTSRAYGQTNPPFTATFRGLVNGEDASVLQGQLVFNTAADTNSPVGTYPIIPSGLAATNYSLAFSNGTLTVTAFALTVSADPVSRPYGATNPPLTGTLSGVQSGDNLTVTFQTFADTNSPVGDYPILPVLNDPEGRLVNYTVLTNTGPLTIVPAALLVQAQDASRVYGQTNPPFTATLSGWVNGEDVWVLQGQLVINTPADTNSPVGTYPITPGGLTATNYSLTFSNGSLTVTAEALTLTVDSFSRPYGATNPPLTGTLTGLQNGDAISASFLTAADTNSPVGVYPITPGWTDPEGKLVNYTVLTNNGALTITKAASVAVIGSSADPALLGSPVTFTVNLTAAVPSGGVPSGKVQFMVDGGEYQAPVTLSDGGASLTTTTLTSGQHTVSMYYAGDENFLETTADLNPSQVINTPPVAGDDIIYRVPDQGTRVPVSFLLANDSDADGDPLVLDSVTPTSTAGGTLSETNGWIYYAPPNGFTNGDSFTYIVSDGRGGTATGMVTVSVLAGRGSAATLTLLNLGDGVFRIISAGVPWGNYTIKVADAPTALNWETLAVGTADSLGDFAIDEPEPPGTQARFYRAIYEGDGATSLPFLLALTSSANPALPGSAVTFTANLGPIPPFSDMPSGNLQFYVDGLAYGNPVMLMSGSASLTTTLSSGEHTVSAVYSGDENFRTTTSILGKTQVINAPPVAQGYDVQCNPTDVGVKFRFSDLNYSDPDGDPLVFSMSTSTTEGGAITMAEGWVFYTPPAGFLGGDSFTYTVHDQFGATATAMVQILPAVGSGENPSANLVVVDLGSGTYRIIFSGIPWRTYEIQYTDSMDQPSWQSLVTRTADSEGRFEYDDTLPEGTSSRFYRSVSEFALPTASPFRLAVWTNFIGQTNGRTMNMWSERTLPAGWPDTAPLLAWDTNCLLYGFEGFTGISQCNEFEGTLGQIPVTLLTRRHGYTRGHGMGENGLHTSLAGKRVWFCTADNSVVQMTVAAELVRDEYVAGSFYDYTILVFTEDVPETISFVSVVSPADMEIYYWNTPDLPYLFLATEQQGHCAADVPPFVYPILKGGDSGSPDLIPSPDNKLIMFSGRGTSGFSPQMQADIDALSIQEGLNPQQYQLRWFDLSPWGP